MSHYLVGLTGGLASGKSTIAQLMRDAGFVVVDADRLVADLYQPGAAGARVIQELLGDDALRSDGAVDHAAVGARIFGDATLRARLEHLIHPLVRQRFAEIAAEHDGIVVLEATLLVEAGFADDFDCVVVVEPHPDAQLQRAIARGLTEDDARARLTAQGDGAQRRLRADRILRNEGTLEELHSAVANLISEIRALAA